MSESLAFLKCIEHCPYDSDLRLVYSDWLEENDLPKESSRQREIAEMLRCGKFIILVSKMGEPPPTQETRLLLRKSMECELNLEFVKQIQLLVPGKYKLQIGPIEESANLSFVDTTYNLRQFVKVDKLESSF